MTTLTMSYDYEYLDTYLEGVTFPRMVRVKQHFPRPRIDDRESRIREQMGRPEIASKVRPGMRIAVTCGSRGIVGIAEMIRTVCTCLKELGASPFIVPAMGSHGGATAEGQREIVEGYGVTEEYCGAPIVSSMEVTRIGSTADGRDVCIDANAAAADGIVLVGRVKPHTDFRGDYESGLMKMMVIGLGKQRGAENFHREGPSRMAYNIPMFGNAILANANVLFGLAILENAYEETADICAVPAEKIAAEEPLLLKRARELIPQSYIHDCDLLIVDRIGKDISGDGMDPNITGRFCNPYVSGGLNAVKMAVLDISPASHGQMAGLGYGDVTTLRCLSHCDFTATLPNAFTSTTFTPFRVPMVMDTDRHAIAACLKYSGSGDPAAPRVIRILDTLHMDEIMISEALIPEAEAHPMMEIAGEPREMCFDGDGVLEPF